MPTPYTITAHFHVLPNAIDAMKRLIADVTAASLREEGVQVYHWSQRADDPTWFLLYIECRDRAAFEAHVASPHVQQAEKLLEQNMLVEPSDEQHYFRL